MHFSVALLYHLLSQSARHTAECVRSGLDGLMTLVQARRCNALHAVATHCDVRCCNAERAVATRCTPLQRAARRCCNVEERRCNVQHKMKPVRDHATKALARLAHAEPDLMAASANPLARRCVRWSERA